MYPQWVEQICRTPCECHGLHSVDDIVAIGVAKPGKGAEHMGPMAMVMVVCPSCGQLMNITVREPLKSVIAAMRQLVEVIDEVGRNTPPPFNLPRRKPQPTGDDTAANASKTRRPPRPSVRNDQPMTPPTQREIRSFLHRLRLNSFKRGAKDFSSWMKDLGAAGDDYDEKTDPPHGGNRT
jgi:hypothetical protein